jgi:hypothetical protein
MSLNLSYIPHLVYSLAIASLATHLLAHRKEWEAARAQMSARISVLESLSSRLRNGQTVEPEETQRLLGMVDAGISSIPRHTQPPAEGMGWRTVFLGRPDTSTPGSQASTPTQPTRTKATTQDDRDWDIREQTQVCLIYHMQTCALLQWSRHSRRNADANVDPLTLAVGSPA